MTLPDVPPEDDCLEITALSTSIPALRLDNAPGNVVSFNLLIIIHFK